MRVERIRDNGKKFVLSAGLELFRELKDIFSGVGLGISVTKSSDGKVNILYTENNRDIVLRMLKGHLN